MSAARSGGTASEGGALRLEAESFGRVVEVCDGFWVLATRHALAMNDRCLVFRLYECSDGARANEPVLVVVNAVAPDAIPEVQRLASATGLCVRYIVSPGAGHASALAAWYPEFPDAKILVGPMRTPRTPSGKALLELPRVEVMRLEDPLPQFKGQLDAVLFHGLAGVMQLPSLEGVADRHGPFKTIAHLMFNVQDPVDELWLHHAASGTVIGGENLGWFTPSEEVAREPMVVRERIVADRLWIQRVARKVVDPEAVAACWRRVLVWPARVVMTYHDAPTTAFLGDGQAALRDAVREAGQLRD